MRQQDRKKGPRAQMNDSGASAGRGSTPALTVRATTPPTCDHHQSLRLVCDSLRNIAEDICGSNRLRLDDEIRRLEAIQNG